MEVDSRSLELIQRLSLKSTSSEVFTKIYYHQEKSDHLIVILHDYFDYHKRYLNLKDNLQKEGAYDVGFIDFLGFGLSGGKRGEIHSAVNLRDSLENFLVLQSKDHHYQSLTLIGAGLGGLVCLDFFINRKLALPFKNYSQIVINPMLKIHHNIYQKIETFLASKLMLDLFIPEYDIFENCSDMKSAQELLSDPLAVKSMFPSSFEKIKKLSENVKKNMYFLENHTLFLIGARGKVVDNYLVRLFKKAMPETVASLQEYSQSGHDLLHDVEKDIVIKDIIKWLKSLD